MKTLILSKPSESRHAHLRPLPFESLSHITHLETRNLCLAEIDFLCKQLQEAHAILLSIICKSIETWCDTRRFSFEIIRNHAQLQHVFFQFMEDGQSGFASFHSVPASTTSLFENRPKYRTLTLTSIRDTESTEQRRLLSLMEEIENDRDEVYTQEDIDQVERKRDLLMEDWHHLEIPLLQKYAFFSNISHLEHLAFGTCYAWTPVIWRKVFQQVIISSPELTTLELHGWDQLGKLERAGCHSSTIQPVRADAEEAIAESFELMPQLTLLRLVDFSIGPGLLKAGKYISNSLQHLEVVFSKSFVRYFTEPADVWLLVGPLKEFILAAFPTLQNQKKTRTVNIYLHTDLIHEIKHNQYFKDEPLLESLQDNLKDVNVQVNLKEIHHL